MCLLPQREVWIVSKIILLLLYIILFTIFWTHGGVYPYLTWPCLCVYMVPLCLLFPLHKNRSSVSTLMVSPRCLYTGGVLVALGKHLWVVVWKSERNVAGLLSTVLSLAALVVSSSVSPWVCSWPASSVHGDFPGKYTGVGCHALLQGIFPTQGSNPGLLYYHLSHQGSPNAFSAPLFLSTLLLLYCQWVRQSKRHVLSACL